MHVKRCVSTTVQIWNQFNLPIMGKVMEFSKNIKLTSLTNFEELLKDGKKETVF